MDCSTVRDVNNRPSLFLVCTPLMYLALRKADGTFAFNGNWAINWSGEYPAAGTVFNYRRQDASTPELIYSPGPLTEPIDIMVN